MFVIALTHSLSNAGPPTAGLSGAGRCSTCCVFAATPPSSGGQPLGRTIPIASGCSPCRPCSTERDCVPDRRPHVKKWAAGSTDKSPPNAPGPNIRQSFAEPCDGLCRPAARHASGRPRAWGVSPPCSLCASVAHCPMSSDGPLGAPKVAPKRSRPERPAIPREAVRRPVPSDGATCAQEAPHAWGVSPLCSLRTVLRRRS